MTDLLGGDRQANAQIVRNLLEGKENGPKRDAVLLNAAAALPSTGMHHVAVVIDDDNDQMLLYIDGAPAGSVALTGTLAAIHDINNWLGRSQYSTDAELGGALHELRIYAAPLSAAQIAFSFADGPDPAYLPP